MVYVLNLYVLLLCAASINTVDTAFNLFEKEYGIRMTRKKHVEIVSKE